MSFAICGILSARQQGAGLLHGKCLNSDIFRSRSNPQRVAFPGKSAHHEQVGRQNTFLDCHLCGLEDPSTPNSMTQCRYAELAKTAPGCRTGVRRLPVDRLANEGPAGHSLEASSTAGEGAHTVWGLQESLLVTSGRWNPYPSFKSMTPSCCNATNGRLLGEPIIMSTN